MSHNRHYILINDTSKEDVEYNSDIQRLNEYGMVDYWSIINVLDLQDKNDDKVIKGILDYFNTEFGEKNIQSIRNNIKELTETANDENRYQYFALSELYRTLFEVVLHKNEILTKENLVDTNDYFGYSYENVGLTNMVYDLQEGDTVFLVEVDCHS